MRLSVVKRMFGDHIASRMVKMQNRELTFRVIAYNMHRMTDCLYIIYPKTLQYIMIDAMLTNPK